MNTTPSNRTATLFLAIAASASLLGCGTMAQTSVRDTASTPGIGYWKDSASSVVKSGYGLCWRAGYWTPAMATAECDPDLVPKPAPAPAPVVVPPPPPPKPAPAP